MLLETPKIQVQTIKLTLSANKSATSLLSSSLNQVPLMSNSIPYATSHAEKDPSISGYYQQQQKESPLRYSQSGFRKRVVQNNVRGKTLDKVTQEMMKPEPSDIVSTYQYDYNNRQQAAGSRARAVRTSQGFRERGNYDTFQTPTKAAVPHQPYATTDTITASEQRHDLQLNSPDQHQFAVTDQLTPQTVSNAGMQQSGEKKMNKMMYSTQWEPFFKLPKKQELRANNFRGPKSSLYTRDYVAQSLDGRGAMMRNDLYTTKQKRDAMDMRTTMKSDFKDWHMGAPDRAKEDRGPGYEIPFGGNSYYRSEFVNWGGNAADLQKPLQPLTIIPDLKLTGKTMYKDTFTGKPSHEKVQSQKKTGGGVYTQSIPFLGETSYQKTFRPFRVGGNPGYQKKESKPNSVSSFPGHYSTTFGTSYSDPKQKIYWPGEEN